jgi:hypothetical protein
MTGEPLPGRHRFWCSRGLPRTTAGDGCFDWGTRGSRGRRRTVAKLRALGCVGATWDRARDRIGLRARSTTRPASQARGKAKARSAFNRRSSSILAGLGPLEPERSVVRREHIARQVRHPLVRAFANQAAPDTRYLIGRAIGYQRPRRVDQASSCSQTPPSQTGRAEIWLFRPLSGSSGLRQRVVGLPAGDAPRPCKRCGVRLARYCRAVHQRSPRRAKELRTLAGT